MVRVSESIAMGQGTPVKFNFVDHPSIIPKEHVVDIPTTDLSSDDRPQASSSLVVLGHILGLMSRFWAMIISCWKLGQSSGGLPVSTSDNTNTNTNTNRLIINPIAQLGRDQETGKAVLTFVVPITTLVMTVYNKDDSSPQPFSLIFVSLSVGLTALWNGLLLRNTLPDTFSHTIEQFGANSIFFAFFTVVSSFLPPNLVWTSWTCFASILLSSILSCIPVTDRARNE